MTRTTRCWLRDMNLLFLIYIIYNWLLHCTERSGGRCFWDSAVKVHWVNHWKHHRLQSTIQKGLWGAVQLHQQVSGKIKIKSGGEVWFFLPLPSLSVLPDLHEPKLKNIPLQFIIKYFVIFKIYIYKIIIS